MSALQKNLIYNASSYSRLSDDDGDKPESNSITNQKEFIREYLKSMPEIRLCSERVDDGFSGVDFFRPDFQRMMTDIRVGTINCVVVKDLSRLGRNYIETGKYLNEFAERGIRFIAINDGYDSANPQGQANTILIPIKNLINDSYSRDISVKVRSHLEVKKRKGEFVGAFAAYGYLKSPDNRNQLIVDEYAAAVVQDIFRWKLEGMSQQGIADRLNESGVLSPSEYKRSLGLKYTSGFQLNPQALWSAVAVERILKNPVYLGVMVQGKRGRPNYKIKTSVEKPENAWIRVENTHEPIVSEDDFRTVNGLLQTDTRIATDEKTVYLFSGLLFCADCHENMVRKTVSAKGKKYFYYTCSTNRADRNGCTTHNISESLLIDTVTDCIRAHIDSILNIEKALDFIATLPAQKEEAKKVDRQIEKLKAEHEQAMLFKVKAYEKYIEGILPESTFKEYQAVYTKKCEEIETAMKSRKQELDAIVNADTKTNDWINYFKAFQSVDKLERKILVKLINKIYVHERNRIEIIFKYQNEYMAVVESIAKRTPQSGSSLPAKEAM